MDADRIGGEGDHAVGGQQPEGLVGVLPRIGVAEHDAGDGIRRVPGQHAQQPGRRRAPAADGGDVQVPQPGDRPLRIAACGVHPGRVPAQAGQVGGQADPLLHDVGGGLVQGQRQEPEFCRDLRGGVLIGGAVLACAQEQYLGGGSGIVACLIICVRGCR